MIPKHRDGRLPVGIHVATWAEIEERFGTNPRRLRMLMGVRTALAHLADAGCERAFLAGSFVTTKVAPGDVDVAWQMDGVDFERVHPMFLEPRGRQTTLALFSAEFFPAEAIEADSELTFLAFFQLTKDGEPVGIVAVELGEATS